MPHDPQRRAWPLQRWLALCAVLVCACTALPGRAQDAVADDAIHAWLMRVHEAARRQTFVGTFVVSSGAQFSSARIWHACDGTQQLERIDALSGIPRTTFRHNEQVVTFYPRSHVVVREDRQHFGPFPQIQDAQARQIPAYYRFNRAGTARLAGLETDVVELLPRDSARYGYRIWGERRSGLVVQLQVLAADATVLEQSAFSELTLDARVSMSQLMALMQDNRGYQLLRPQVQSVLPGDLGWGMRREVPGFQSVGCYRRTIAAPGATANRADATLQWMFSDGLATVSLFIDPYDSSRHVHEGAVDMGGATHSVAHRLGDWWITAVGEVPVPTLFAFTQAVERRP